MPIRRQAADLIISNAVVRTLDGADSIANAVAAKDGKIVAVGADDEVLDLGDRETTRVNARARTVLPGFIDGHTHLTSAAIERMLLIDYLELDPPDIASALEPVRQRAESLPKGTWIRADDLMESYLAEHRLRPAGSSTP
jgi:predicted amidohydrolase YtcJ